MPYVFAYTDMGDPDNYLAMRAIQFALLLLLVIICVNVAILVYARTATRRGEIAVRGALGASRFRIVAQLFVEALTLAGVAAAIGLFAAADRHAATRRRIPVGRRGAPAVLDGVSASKAMA